jgi:hypothetical protein
MAKSLKDIVKGVKSSKTDAGKLGKDPGVDYEPKAGDEQKFVGKHSVEKHADRTGNGDDIYNATNVKHSLDDKAKEPRHGHRKGEDKKVYEAKKAEDNQCNRTPKGTDCPKHGLNECSMNEDDQAEGYINIGSGGASPFNKFGDRNPGTRTLGKEKQVYKPKQQRDSESAKKFAAIRSNTQKEEVIDEVLTKSTTAGKTIHDFVHSKDKKFDGDSKEQRKKRALGAYYAKQNEEAGESNENFNEVSEIVEVNHRDYGAKGKMHPDIAKNMKVGQHVDFYAHGAGDKQYGMVTKNTGTAVHIKADKKTHKFSVTPNIGENYAVEPLLGGMKPSGSSDEAVEMVKSELKALANKAMHLVSQMPDSMHVEPWVQAKIAQAKSYVSDVHDYCIYGDHDKPEEDEQMDTPITFPGMSVDQGRI